MDKVEAYIESKYAMGLIKHYEETVPSMLKLIGVSDVVWNRILRPELEAVAPVHFIEEGLPKGTYYVMV
jgi:hypothetical protein